MHRVVVNTYESSINEVVIMLCIESLLIHSYESSRNGVMCKVNVNTLVGVN